MIFDSNYLTRNSQVYSISITAGILRLVNRPSLQIHSEDDEEHGRMDVNMYTNILVPLDGSKQAEMILPYVLELALRFETSVILLRVIELLKHDSRPKASFSSLELENTEQRIDDAGSYLSAIQGEFHHRGIQVKAVIEEGPVVKRICQVASSEDVDLIAMASHGRTGFEWVFYGSVAAGVLHQVDRPLLLIRSRGEL